MIRKPIGIFISVVGIKCKNTVHTVSIPYIWTVFSLKSLKIRTIAWLLLVAAAAFVIFSADSYLLQRRLAGKTIRLHVVANSDSDRDQEEKLKVRDAVLQKVAALTADCRSAEAARAALAAHLDELREAAQSRTRNTVSVQLGEEDFATRYYDTFTLPAGVYSSLRVNIGAAQGHNWWCVVFPSLCTAATADDLSECAAAGGFDDSETELVTGGEDKYVLRFKTLEWLEKLKDWLRR